jgi:type I restriction enzyme S subunit
MSERIPDGWAVSNFSDICFFQEGPGLRRWQYRETGFPFLNIRCIKEGQLDLSQVQYISNDEAYSKYKHFFLEAGDIVLSSSGTLGRLAKVQLYNLPLMLNTSVIRFKPADERKLSSDFLYHYLQSGEFQDQISEESQGSAQANFGPTHLKRVTCSLPPPPEQQKIASILISVDEVIEKTEAQIHKLQDLKKGMMQELLTKGIGHTEFKDSSVGRIPREWDVGKLGDFIELLSDYHANGS